MFLIGLLSKCSWRTLYRLSDVAAFILFRLLRYRKSVIDANLQNSFPEKSPAEIAAIRKRFYTHFTDLVVETIKVSECPKEDLLERVVMSAESEMLLRKVKTGSVVLLGHRGNWEMANLFISAKKILEPIVVYKPLADSGFESWFRANRTRFGSTMAPMKQVYEELEKERDRPYAVFLVNDQSPNPGRAYWTGFLNQNTGVFRGAEIISRKHGIPVLFADIRCLEGRRGYYEVEIKLFTEDPASCPQNSILENQIRYLEKNIRAQPFNWLWSHKRWKHPRPEKPGPDQILETSDGWEKEKQNF